MPESAPPTDATASSPGTTGTTSTNPGGAAGYEGNSTSIQLSSNTASVFSGLTAPAGNMPANAPSGFDQLEVPTHIAGSPASKGANVNKGVKAPDITRLSDLVKLVNAVANSQSLQGFDPQVVADIAKQAKLTPGQIAGLTAGGGEDQGISTLNEELLTPEVTKKVTGVAWKDITTHLARLGVSLNAYPGIEKPPNAYNISNKLRELGGVRLESPVTTHLKAQGYDVEGMTDVKSLVSGHDSQQFSTGAPGTPQNVPATPARNGKTNAEALWNNFVTDWQGNAKTNGVSFQDSTVQSLVAIGALDITGGAPTIDQVAAAYQNVIKQAATDGVSVPQEFTQLEGQVPPGPAIPGGGTEDINTANVNQAFILHYADQLLGQNAITPYQANVLANVASKAGTSTPATDLINQGIIGLYQQKLQNDPTSATTGGASYAAIAYQNIQDQLSQQGVQATPQMLAQLVTQVLTTGVDTPYQISTLAQTAAEAWAKDNIANVYGAGVAASVKAGTSVQQQAQTYLQTASSLLGTPTSEMNISDPSGQWMKWSEGGTGPGGTMTQQEWSHYLQSDPTYGYDNTQQARTNMASATDGILQLFGKLPSSSSPFSGAASSTASPAGTPS
jgi:hypothetical protein